LRKSTVPTLISGITVSVASASRQSRMKSRIARADERQRALDERA
jgi:hypothetical protein